MTVRGLDTFVARIDRLHTNSNATAKRAVHAGAKVVADKIRKNLTGVTVIPKWQKKDLLDSFGISPVDVDAAKNQAINEMERVIDEEVKKILKE